MYFDSNAWPPPPDGVDPDPAPRPPLTPVQERRLMRLIGLFLIVLFLGPFAGSSLLVALVALCRAVVQASG